MHLKMVFTIVAPPYTTPWAMILTTLILHFVRKLPCKSKLFSHNGFKDFKRFSPKKAQVKMVSSIVAPLYPWGP
jgi:hypothetical protein